MMLIVVVAATLMDGLDASIVSIALPDIAEDLGVDTATSSWATIIYLLVLSALIIPFARISAQTGVRKVLAIGLAMFTIGSALCGLSPSFATLIAFRTVQAVGAAMMAAAGPMCCTEHLSPDRLGLGMSLVTIGASLGFAVGPAVGGAVTELLSWQWIFLINIPFGLVTVPLILIAIPASSETGGKPRVDLRGAAVLCTSVVLGVLGLEILSYEGTALFSTTCMMACIVLLALFIRLEKNTDIPLLRTSMLRDFGFASVFLCLMLVNASFMGVMYLVPFFGQIVLGMSPFEVGEYLLISAVFTAVLGMPIARWSDRAGRRWFCIAAGIVLTVGFLMYALWADGMSDLELLTTVLVMGLGWALVGGPMASRLVEHAGNERDMAASLMNEAYYIGGAVGTAFAAMFFTIMSGAEGVDISLLSAGMFLDGFVPTALASAAVAVAIFVLSTALRDD